MNIFARVMQQLRVQRSRERRMSDAEMIAMMDVRRSASGAFVTPETALTFSAVLACVRVLSESVASLPLIVYRRAADGGKSRASDHPLYTLLHDAPNPEMTSTQWRETSMAHLTLWGNAYSEVVTDQAGRVREIWPLMPPWMEVTRTNAGALLYRYREPGKAQVDYTPARILHIAGLSLNGVTGISPIALARESIGLALTLNDYGAKTFANGARAGGVLEHPGVLSDEAFAKLRASFEAEYAGAANAGKTIILEEGMKFSQVSFPPDDAQFLESRKFQVSEIARIFRVPPHMIGDLERATFSNIEHQALEFVQHSLRPWLVRWEQAIMARLLLPAERGVYFAEFLLDGLLRGDIESRYRAYATGRQWGWLSVNDIRARENMNPVEGGDEYLTPMNMTKAGAEGETQ